MDEWTGKSQVVAGLVLAGKIPADSVNPNILIPPYDQLVTMYSRGKSQEEIYDEVGSYHYTEAEASAKHINGVLSIDYVQLCEWAAIRTRAGERLEPVINRWKDGRSKEGDIELLIQAVEDLNTPMSKIVNLEGVEPMPGAFMKTGYHPFDEFFGGLPADSMTVIGGPPGTGKTSICARLMIEMAKQDKDSLIFSLEMTLNQLKYRMKEIAGTRLAKKYWERMWAAEKVFDMYTIMSEAVKFGAQHEHLGLIIIDFADMVRGRSYGRTDRVAIIDELYRTFAELALKLKVPVVVLSQLNDQYVGGRPRVNHLRGSRLIEALAAMIILLYNPDMIDVNQSDSVLPSGEGVGWLILGKSRYGFGEAIGAPGNTSGTIGAVNMQWKGAQGWDDIGNYWRALSNA